MQFGEHTISIESAVPRRPSQNSSRFFRRTPEPVRYLIASVASILADNATCYPDNQALFPRWRIGHDAPQAWSDAGNDSGHLPIGATAV